MGEFQLFGVYCKTYSTHSSMLGPFIEATKRPCIHVPTFLESTGSSLTPTHETELHRRLMILVYSSIPPGSDAPVFQCRTCKRPRQRIASYWALSACLGQACAGLCGKKLGCDLSLLLVLMFMQKPESKQGRASWNHVCHGFEVLRN